MRNDFEVDTRFYQVVDGSDSHILYWNSLKSNFRTPLQVTLVSCIVNRICHEGLKVIFGPYPVELLVPQSIFTNQLILSSIKQTFN